MILPVHDKTHSDSGVALVVVLWFLVLLSVIATHLSFSSRTEARISHNLFSAAQAGYAADAGVQWAIWRLSLPAQQQWLADGGVHEVALAEATVRVSLQDENGKLNINSVGAAELLPLFAAAGVDETTASMLTDRILDWRDKDDLKRLNGAENEDYIKAGLDYEIGDGLFRSLEQLQKVLGMEAWIYKRIEPALSTRSRFQGVNPLVAPRLVLLSMPGATEELVEQYIEQRRSDREAGLVAKGLELPLAQFIPVTTPGVYYTIETESRLRGGAGARQKLQLVRSGAGQQVRYKIIEVIDLYEPEQPICPGQECPELR